MATPYSVQALASQLWVAREGAARLRLALAGLEVQEACAVGVEAVALALQAAQLVSAVQGSAT